jgi:glycosyltransferase involved in cell wall biosynthesis
MLLSIVIPTKNRSLPLEKLLFSIGQNTMDSERPELIVVDDCSGSEYQRQNVLLCKKYRTNYCFVNTPKGPAYTRNIGINSSQGKWVAFLDDDVFLSNGWYPAAMDRIKSVDDTIAGIEGATYSTGRGLWDREVENRHGGLYLACNIIYRKEILRRCGGFDEGFTGPFAEDQELAVRVKRWGPVVFDDRMVVYHGPRNVNLVFYVRSSFSRMRQLLDAEFHFFIRQRDAYHTMRFAATFWRGYCNLLFKNILISLRRRSIGGLIGHPLQTAALVLAGGVEQFAAGALFFRYVARWRTGHTLLPTAMIDQYKTARLWGIKESFSVKLLQFNPNLFGSCLFKIRRKPVYDARVILKKTRAVTTARISKVFLRIDDVFCSDPSMVAALLEKMPGISAPFLAAVTGSDLLHHTSLPLLGRIIDKGGKIGLHGFLHKGVYGPYISEMLQLTYPHIDCLCNTVARCAGAHDINLVAFVPPFNAITWEQIVHLSRQFPVVCGGPETARFTGNIFGPLRLQTGSIYFPSYYPFYGKAKNMLSQTFFDMVLYAHAPVCITLHMQTEAADSFVSLPLFLNRFKSLLADWETLIPAQSIRKDREPAYHENLVYSGHTL